MKKQLVSIAVGIIGVLSLHSCIEKGPAIDFSNVRADDTSYMLPTPEAAQPRQVLVEEATGASYSNCPTGAKMLQEANVANGDRLIILGLHYNNLANPTSHSKYDFRNGALKGIFDLLGPGEPAKPAVVFDRVKQSSGYWVVNRTAWSSLITDRVNIPSPIRLSMTSGYNPVTREDTIRIRVSYTSQVTKNQNMSIVILEDDIIDAQYDGVTILEDYHHKHVFRDFVTPVSGKSFLDGQVKEPGIVYERTFIYKVPDVAFGVEKTKWNLDNCKIVGFISNNEPNDLEVAQAIEIPFK